MTDLDLRSLAASEPPPDHDARVRRLGGAELARAKGPGGRAVAARVSTRVVVPGAVVLTVVGYLHWAVASASSFYQ